MKRIFFIDYENVDTAGLDGVSSLLSQDDIYIYYSERHSRMTFGLHRRICESSASFYYRKIKEQGKNALDNELVKEASILLNDKKADYYIISKDKGYKSFVKEKLIEGYKTFQYENIKESNQSKREELKKIIKSRLVDDKKKHYNLSDDEIERIVSMIMTSANKSELNINLQKMFFSKDVKYIFSRIKDIIYNY